MRGLGCGSRSEKPTELGRVAGLRGVRAGGYKAVILTGYSRRARTDDLTRLAVRNGAFTSRHPSLRCAIFRIAERQDLEGFTLGSMPRAMSYTATVFYLYPSLGGFTIRPAFAAILFRSHRQHEPLNRSGWCHGDRVA